MKNYLDYSPSHQLCVRFEQGEVEEMVRADGCAGLSASNWCSLYRTSQLHCTFNIFIVCQSAVCWLWPYSSCCQQSTDVTTCRQLDRLPVTQTRQTDQSDCRH